MEIRKAQRKQAKIKLALEGVSGPGKTRGVGCQHLVTGLNEAIGMNKCHWFVN